MTITNEDQQKAGFWVRLLATWLDLLVISILQKVLFYTFLFLHINLYLPTELTYIIFLLVYFAVSISSKGQTLGKWLLGIKVLSQNDEKLSIFKSILRESILKFISGAILFLGFIWIAFSRNKKGWHDYIVRSKAIRVYNSTNRILIWKTIGIVSFTTLFGCFIWEMSSILYLERKIVLPKKVFSLPFVNRNANETHDISAITSDTTFVNWLNKNAKTPEEYAIHIVSTHDLTLFGESHEVKNNLDFLNRIIPDLYYKAGVRCIGMECIPSSMNKAINDLINGNEYNDKLALLIARSVPWKAWAFQEYWDVLETVWRLNKSLPDTSKKMRIVGIDIDWDGLKIAMVLPGVGNEIKNIPLYEKLKIFTFIPDLINVVCREELMVRNVEKEIFEKGDRGIVWIGSAHSMLQYGYPLIYNNKLLFIKSRFGLILSQKYKDRVGQILMWQSLEGADKSNKKFDNFVESVMTKRNNRPVGFSIEGSPFGMLRDSTGEHFNKFKTICFQDLYQGLIFLNPIDKLQHCTYTKNYISREMFLKYKYFYELKIMHNLHNNEECNKEFEKLYKKVK